MEKPDSNLSEIFPHIKEGTYTPPREVMIGSIPGVVVDPHNEVFGYWGEFLKGKKVTLLHIDAHPDMGADVVSRKILREQGRDLDCMTYGKDVLSIQNFIAAAVYEEMVGTVYGYNPRREDVEFYGQDLSTEVVDGNIQWAGEAGDGYAPTYTPLKIDDVVAQINRTGERFILDIDLDAFALISDSKYRPPDDARRGKTQNAEPLREDMEYDNLVQMHFERVMRLLSTLPKPIGISIARSQTPYAYTPSEKVDSIEAEQLSRLSELYGKAA